MLKKYFLSVLVASILIIGTASAKTNSKPTETNENAPNLHMLKKLPIKN